jgi:hypothetical protein
VNCNTVTGGLDIGSPLTTGLGMQDLTYGGSSGTPGVGGGLDGIPDIAFFNVQNPTKKSQMQYNGRLDADVTQKDRLAFAIYWVPQNVTNYNGTVRPENLWHHSQINDAFSMIWNHTFSPTLLNQARANAAGWRWNEVTSNPQAPFGLPQDNFPVNAGSAGISFFGAPGPSNYNQWTYTYNDVLTKIAGRHSIKAGVEFTELYFLNNPVYAARPGFNFYNIWDFANDAPFNESGQFDSKTGTPFANRQDDREKMWGLFVQDDFKLRSNLTINLGLRWSYFGALYPKQNNQDIMQFGSGPNPLTNLNIRVGSALYTPQKNNLGPVLGFAWSPTKFESKLVFRGGFGINYNQNEIAITSNGVGNPPNAVNGNFTCDYPFTDPSCQFNGTPPNTMPTGILYETATNIHSIFGYAPNPAAITAFGSNNLPLTGSAFITGFQSNPKTIANYHYSFDMQYQLPFNSVFTVGYQGNQTRHLLVHNNWNAIAAANGLALNPVVNTVNFWQNTGTSNYNAMNASITHNFSHEFQASAQYTWARAMDNNSGPYYQDPYPFDTAAAYGRSNYDVRNAFKLFGLWQPVFFRGSHSWAEKIAGGWSLSGIWNIHSGFPFDPFYNTAGNLYTGNSGYGTVRPAAVVPGAGTSTDNQAFMHNTNPNYGGNGTTFFTGPTYVTAPAFPAISPAPLPGIHRNSLSGPGYNDVDVSLAKGFGLPKMPLLGESARFEIRADVYNFFNKININTASIDGRLGSVNPDGSVANFNTNFGVAGNALGSRTIQLQARFSF